MQNKDLQCLSIETQVNNSIPIDAGDTVINASSGYVLVFIHPKTQQYILLANNADIPSICYSSNPYLPGTCNPMYAKFYTSLEDLKADVYLLRYHHRKFLNVKMIAKPAQRVHKELNQQNILTNSKIYYLDELEYFEN